MILDSTSAPTSAGVIVFELVSIPFRVAFAIEVSAALALADLVVDALFALDILLTMRTAFNRKDVRVV